MPTSSPPPNPPGAAADAGTDAATVDVGRATRPQAPVDPDTMTTVSPSLPRVPGYVLAIAGLALTSGTIHVVAAVEHVGINWQLGAFFAVVGACQVVAAHRIYRNPGDEWTLKLAAAGSVIVSLMWVFSRTTGIPFGPEPGRASVGVADTITTVQQFILAAIVVAFLWRRDGDGQRLSWMGGGLATRMMFAFLSCTMMMAAIGGHQH